MKQADVIVIGAGIVGLAHALAAAKRGCKVVVFERNLAAIGASIRNFGMVWPVGQPEGELYQRALTSREIWLELSSKAGFTTSRVGSIHLAYQPDEMTVLEEFIATRQDRSTVKLLAAAEVAEKSPAAVTDGLLGALWSSTEVIVDPREAIGKLPAYLTEAYGVQFQFGKVVTAIESGVVIAAAEKWQSNQVFICSGADFETLYPDLYAVSGITKVKLQMMRTAPQPDSWRLGAALCSGLTLTHYTAFAHCPSLEALKQRIFTEAPHFPEWGIHVMICQNARGELVIGDSHEYGWNPDPFDRAMINQYILDYLKGFAQVPCFDIAETWHGVYAKLPGYTEWVVQPEPNVTVVNALSGAGMTLSFGLAEKVLSASV